MCLFNDFLTFNSKLNQYKDDERISQAFEEYLGDIDSVFVQFYATFEIKISQLRNMKGRWVAPDKFAGLNLTPAYFLTFYQSNFSPQICPARPTLPSYALRYNTQKYTKELRKTNNKSC